LKKDKQNLLLAASLQDLLELDPVKIEAPLIKTKMDSVLLLDGKGHVWEKSEAILRILILLENNTWFFKALLKIPRLIRDSVYEIVARTRYSIWGKAEECLLPDPSLRKKYLDQSGLRMFLATET
jgi:predicted DCC family thiol-disulfide oxidoreductase YuxK